MKTPEDYQAEAYAAGKRDGMQNKRPQERYGRYTEYYDAGYGDGQDLARELEVDEE